MRHLNWMACATLLCLSAPSLAVSGISVTTHWSGQLQNHTFYGGFGEIWRHDIVDSQVIDDSLLFAGPARMAVINYSGSHVAFLKESGMIAFMPIDGGTVQDLVQAHPHSCLDWPEGDWIYYNLGTWGMETSRFFRRVNVVTGADEAVVELESSTWRFGIARDHKRASIRDTGVQHTIVAYDFETDAGRMRDERAVDVPSCGTGMDPEGEYFMDGMPDHSGFDIRRWSDLEIVETFTHTAATSWGDRDSGEGHNRNGWSTNAQKWICAQVGWNLHFSDDSRGSNQVLYNWLDHERIVVTNNNDNSYTYDSAGDFWVDNNAMNTAPNVSAGPDQTINIFSPALLLGTATDDGLIRTPLSIAWAQVSGPGTAQFANAFEARTTVEFDMPGTYILELGASDGALTSVDQTQITVSSAPVIRLLSPNGGEVWYAGETHAIEWEAVGTDDVAIFYSTDDGATWERIAATVDTSSPAWKAFPWTVPDTASMQCRVSITAYIDGQGKVMSEQAFEIRSLNSDIAIANPVAAAHFVEGDEIAVRFTSDEISAVLIAFSDDDGDSWQPLAFVERGQSQWGDYRWDSTGYTCQHCRVSVSDLSNYYRRSVSDSFVIDAAKAEACGCMSTNKVPPGLFVTFGVIALTGVTARRRHRTSR